MRLTKWIALGAWCLVLAMSSVGCGCGDDDDDSGGGSADDDADDDSADDDTGDDDTSDDDTTDDDTGDDDLGPEAGCIVPADYDGDGDEELAMATMDWDDDRFVLFFVEPGTLASTAKLTLEGVAIGEGGTRFSVADFDQDGIWDVLIAAYDAGTLETTFLVYANGDFETPFYESDPVDANLYAFAILDERNDGFADFVTYCEDCGGDKGYLIFHNEGGTITPGDLIPDEGEGNTAWLPDFVPGRLFPTASNVTGDSGAVHFATYREWDDAGTEYAQFYAYNSLTGAPVASTDPIEALNGNNWSSGRVGDFDGDGITEFIHALTWADDAIPSKEASHTVYGYVGGVFVEEFASTPAADAYAYSLYDFIDVDLDGVLDPFLNVSESGGDDHWPVLNGPDGYSERFTFTLPPGYVSEFAMGHRRGGTAVGFIPAGGLDPSLAVITEHTDGGARTGQLSLLSMLDGSETTSLATIALGEGGRTTAGAADLGGDGIVDVFVLAQEAVWGGADWVYDYRIYLYNGENMDEAYDADVTTAFDSPPWMTMEIDFTGDHAPDPAVVGDVGGETRWLIYPCDSTGCEDPLEIDAPSATTLIQFGGPYL
ncbi:MAG: VCBS repeat-containing protein [Deltaproteobacteria bacterium]|nr:VCBS repeat-containing protein [Deltaproteobacteria bacterium]